MDKKKTYFYKRHQHSKVESAMKAIDHARITAMLSSAQTPDKYQDGIAVGLQTALDLISKHLELDGEEE